jgi:hypothetical protein
MARDAALPPGRGIGAFVRPWPLLLAGLALLLIGGFLRETAPAPLRVSLMVGGLVLAGLAVSRRLQTAGQELEERVESAGLLAVSAFAALLACWISDEWDTILLLMGVLAGLALTGSVLVLLPRTPRRVVASVWILFHFGGITTAVTAVAPRDQPAPWLSQQLWTRVYRPYLQFMYLTNAYHFYSPDPGPPSLLWFRVEYADKTSRWIKLPVREESPFGLHFQRRLALGESVNQPNLSLPLTRAERADWLRRGVTPPDREPWDEILTRRQIGATLHKPPLGVPMDATVNQQYSEPQDHAKRFVASYARHVARTSPNPENPEMPVANVRVYRVTHTIILPGQVAGGYDPLDPAFYSPIYLGQFDAEGRMLDPQDPFLYWYIPMVYVPPNYGKDNVPLFIHRDPQPGDKFLNGVAVHSGDATELQEGHVSDAKRK